MKTIVVAAIKGGTGKTTTAAAIAQAAAMEGRRVLAVDLDPQANLTQVTGATKVLANGYRLLMGTATATEATQRTGQGLDVIAGSEDLTAIRTAQGSASRLRKALAPVKESYDLCIIDTPPQMGELVFNALMAADGLLIPLEADGASLQGFYQVTELARATMHHNIFLAFVGVLVTRYDARARVNRYLRERVEAEAGEAGIPYLGEIRAGVAVKEAQGFAKSLFDYAPKSKPATDYMRLYNGQIKEFLNR